MDKEKRNLLDKLSDKEVEACTRHPLAWTAVTTVGTMATVGIAKGPARKIGRAMRNAASGLFNSAPAEGVSDVVAEKVSSNLAESAFKGGGSEEVAGFAANGLVSIARGLISLVRR